jgi:hypothetical protein
VIRITGVLALMASLGLALLLAGRIERAGIAGPVGKPHPEIDPDQDAYTPAPPDTRPVYIVIQDPLTNQKFQDEGLLGIPFSGLGESSGNEPMTFWWGFQIPELAAQYVQSGDELGIRAGRVSLPYLDEYSVTHVRYDLRRGSKTWSFGDPANGRFVRVCGLAVGAPLLLWGLAVGLVALCGAIMKAPITSEGHSQGG